MTDLEPAAGIRIDKWLWHARVFKTRTQATMFIGRGKVRVNRQKVTKPGRMIKVNDVLTFVLGDDVRVYKILGLGERRGPATEAQQLYENLVTPDTNTESGDKMC
jgi:ribosome-associated heat shock protein Hsp15